MLSLRPGVLTDLALVPVPLVFECAGPASSVDNPARIQFDDERLAGHGKLAEEL